MIGYVNLSLMRRTSRKDLHMLENKLITNDKASIALCVVQLVQRKNTFDSDNRVLQYWRRSVRCAIPFALKQMDSADEYVPAIPAEREVQYG